jgi:hypothetical protein
MSIIGVETNLKELKILILEYKEQLKRMKVSDYDSYPIILNLKYNEEDNELLRFE